MAGEDVTTIKRTFLLLDDRHRGGFGSLGPLLRGFGLSLGWGQGCQGADKGRVVIVSSVSGGGGSRGWLGEPDPWYPNILSIISRGDERMTLRLCA